MGRHKLQYTFTRTPKGWPFGLELMARQLVEHYHASVPPAASFRNCDNAMIRGAGECIIRWGTKDDRELDLKRGLAVCTSAIDLACAAYLEKNTRVRKERFFSDWNVPPKYRVTNPPHIDRWCELACKQVEDERDAVRFERMKADRRLAGVANAADRRAASAADPTAPHPNSDQARRDQRSPEDLNNLVRKHVLGQNVPDVPDAPCQGSGDPCQGPDGPEPRPAGKSLLPPGIPWRQYERAWASLSRDQRDGVIASARVDARVVMRAAGVPDHVPVNPNDIVSVRIPLKLVDLFGPEAMLEFDGQCRGPSIVDSVDELDVDREAIAETRARVPQPAPKSQPAVVASSACPPPEQARAEQAIDFDREWAALARADREFLVKVARIDANQRGVPCRGEAFRTILAEKLTTRVRLRRNREAVPA